MILEVRVLNKHQESINIIGIQAKILDIKEYLDPKR